MHKALLLGLLLAAALPWVAQAQDTTGTVVPTIAPREVEIRGTLEVSLPSLRRQPLVGFNPPPEVPRPPANRRPFLERYKQASSDLPASPLGRPEPPSALGASYPPAQGQVESLVGRYFSRAVNARLQAPLSDNAGFFLRADYRGSDGHEPFDDLPDVNAPFDALEGLAGIQTSGRQWAAGFRLGGFVESFDLYGLQPFTLPSDLSLLSRIERRGRGGVGAATLSTLDEAPVEARLDLRYGATRYEIEDVSDTASGGDLLLTSNLEHSEQRFEADTDISYPIPAGDAWFEGLVSTATLGDDFGSYSAFEAGGGLQFEVNATLSLRLGARLLGVYSDTALPRSTAESTRRGYLAPDVRAEYLPVPGLRLYAHNRPGVEANAMADVYRQNPYLIPRPELRPTIRPIDAEVGGNYFAGPVQLAARGGFQHMPQYLYFEAVSDAGNWGLTSLRYGEANVFHIGGSISVVLPGGLHAMAGLTLRNGRLPDDDVDIPYFAPVVGEATLSYSFAESRGLLQMTGHFEGTRYVDRRQVREVGSYIDLDVEASYKVTTLLGVVFRVENISGSDNARWEHYPESPVLIGAGMRVSW